MTGLLSADAGVTVAVADPCEGRHRWTRGIPCRRPAPPTTPLDATEAATYFAAYADAVIDGRVHVDPVTRLTTVLRHVAGVAGPAVMTDGSGDVRLVFGAGDADRVAVLLPAAARSAIDEQRVVFRIDAAQCGPAADRLLARHR